MGNSSKSGLACQEPVLVSIDSNGGAPVEACEDFR